jgi:integrase-like protein
LAAARSHDDEAPTEGAGGEGRPRGADPHRGPSGGAGEGEGGQGGPRGVRERMPGLLWGAGYLLRRHAQGRGAHLPADVHRHLRQGGVRQALRPQDAADGGRSRERPRPALLRGARHPALPGAHRSWDGVLWARGAPRVRAVPGRGEHRPHPHEGAEPQTNGICERFHKTVLNEFYRVAFRKKLYTTLEELQADLDAWLREYNEQRPHQGRWCYGKTPMQTFLDTLPLAKEKLLVA